jgi:orotidine-5'-phosphate decarboxylase
MKLCVALDMQNTKDILNLLESIKDYNVWIKVGLRLYIREGYKIIDKIKSINNNFDIFLDLKLYDIPNTMADSALEISKLDISMFNIHLSAGNNAINEVVSRLENIKHKPLILGVSVLTSFSNEEFYNIYKQDLTQSVINFSKIGYENNLDGVVCSVHESLKIKNETSNNFITLTPGIRLDDKINDDQFRVATIQMAKDNKSDFIVVGRPIYNSKNPQLMIENILNKI